MPSIFAAKPVLFVRAIFEIFSLLLVRLPIWVLLALPRSNRPRPAWSLGRTLTLRVLQRVGASAGVLKVLIKEPDYRALDKGKGIKGVWVPAIPHLIVGDVKKWAEEANVESINIPAYWLDKEGEDIPVNTRPLEGEKVLYMLHGGAYALQSAHPREMAATVPRGILQHAGSSIHRAFLLEFRNSKPPSQSPSNPFPAALLDAIAGYVYLISEVGFSPENVVVVGDSAGGNLALALTRYLVDNKTVEGIPSAPGAMVLLSPWVDLHPDPVDRTSSFYTNANTDIISDIVDPDGHAVLNFLGPHGKGAAVTNPYISPASTAQTMPPVSFEGYPRTLILSGATEILVDQIRVLYDRMRASADSNVRYVEFPEVWHDFIAFNLEPQKTEALNIIGGWMEE